MVAMLVSALALSAAPADVAMPALVDRELVEYFDRAVEASKSGQRQKALAMLQLLLLPEETTFLADYSGLSPETRAVFEKGVSRGVGLWRDALGSDMPIKSARGNQRPDITLKFVDKVTGSDARCKGEIRAKRWIQWNDQVHYQQFTATVSVCKFADERLMTEAEITHIVAHELGHAIGLGDLTNSGYIMGPVELGNPFAKLNGAEVEAVKAFRAKVRDEMIRITASSPDMRTP